MGFFKNLKKLKGTDVVKGIKKAAPFLPFGQQIGQAIEEAEKAYERSKPKKQKVETKGQVLPLESKKATLPLPLIAGAIGLLLLMGKK